MRRRDLSKALIACATGAGASASHARATIPANGATAYPRSTAEIDAQITPKNLAHPPGNVLRYGADPTGAANSAAAFLDARRIATQTGAELSIPGGNYRSDTTLEWGFAALCVRATGKVTITFSNPGRCISIDGGERSGGIFGVQVLGYILATGNSATTEAWFVRACHHAELHLRAGDCATALRTQWCVLTKFDVTCSSNEKEFSRLKPTAGIIADERLPGESTAGCTFNAPTLEGIAGIGIELRTTLQCVFIGGSSEANKVGVRQTGPNNNGNTFVGMDFEANATQDVIVTGGNNLTLININSLSPVRAPNIEIESGSNTTFVGGFLRCVHVHASATGTALFASQVSEARGLGIQGLGSAATFGIRKVNRDRVVTGEAGDPSNYDAAAAAIERALAVTSKLTS